MLIGTMNHPARNVLTEIKWMSEMGFDFIDLTLEPPAALASQVAAGEIRKALEDRGLGVIGHTAYYLPLCSPFESIRRAAVEELRICLDVFAQVGAKWMNVHPDRQAPLHDRRFIIDKNLQTLGELLPFSRSSGVGIMVENLPAGYNNVRQLSEILEPLPEIGLHLDIGHCNLLVDHNTADELLQCYGARLKHVHLHDNKGGSADLHLPLGAGTLNTEYYIKALQHHGYDGTITLEVFTPDRRHLDYSRQYLREIWDRNIRLRLSAVAAVTT